MTGNCRGWDVSAARWARRADARAAGSVRPLHRHTVAQSLTAGIRGARLETLPESSHTHVLEETARYIAVVGAFLAGAEDAG
jgi:pimeloyl-ACP methyl ester carboxylesterase